MSQSKKTSNKSGSAKKAPAKKAAAKKAPAKKAASKKAAPKKQESKNITVSDAVGSFMSSEEFVKAMDRIDENIPDQVTIDTKQAKSWTKKFLSKLFR